MHTPYCATNKEKRATINHQGQNLSYVYPIVSVTKLHVSFGRDSLPHRKRKVKGRPEHQNQRINMRTGRRNKCSGEAASRGREAACSRCQADRKTFPDPSSCANGKRVWILRDEERDQMWSFSRGTTLRTGQWYPRAQDNHMLSLTLRRAWLSGVCHLFNTGNRSTMVPYLPAYKALKKQIPEWVSLKSLFSWMSIRLQKSRACLLPKGILL